MLDKIINVATGQQGLSVAGDCILLEVQRTKNHEQRPLPFGVGLRKNKESSRQRCVDDEEARSWAKLIQGEIEEPLAGFL